MNSFHHITYNLVLWLALMLCIPVSASTASYPGKRIKDVKKYNDYAYKVVLDHSGSYQSGFRVKGYPGVFTTLHGFLAHSPGANFSNYIIVEILNAKGEQVSNDDYLKGKGGKVRKAKFTVTKVDWRRDLAYIEVPSWKEETDKGFEVIPNMQSFMDEMEMSAELITFPFEDFMAHSSHVPVACNDFKELNESLPDHIGNPLVRMLQKIRIPDLDIKVMRITEFSIEYGFSGAALIDQEQLKLCGYFSIGFPVSTSSTYHHSFAIPFSTAGLMSWNELVLAHEEIVLEHAHGMYFQWHLSNTIDCNTAPGSHQDTLTAGQRELVGKRFGHKPWFNNVKAITKAVARHQADSNAQALEMLTTLFGKRIPEMRNNRKKKFTEKHASTYNYFQTYTRFHFQYPTATAPTRRAEILKQSVIWADKLYESSRGLEPSKREKRNWAKTGLDQELLTNNLIRDVIRETACDSLRMLVDYYCALDDYKNLDRTLARIASMGCSDAKQVWEQRCALKDLVDSTINSFLDSARASQEDCRLHCALDYYLAARAMMPLDTGIQNSIARLRHQISSEKAVKTKEEIISEVNAYAQTILYGTQIMQNVAYTEIVNLDISQDNMLVLTTRYGMDTKPLHLKFGYANFPPGEYICEGSRNAIYSIEKIIHFTCEKFADYLNLDSASLTIIGQADGLPYRGQVRYHGEWGRLNKDTVHLLASASKNVDYIEPDYYAYNKLPNHSNGQNARLAHLRAKDAHTILTASLGNIIPEDSIQARTVDETDGDIGTFRNVQIGLKVPLSEHVSDESSDYQPHCRPRCIDLCYIVGL